MRKSQNLKEKMMSKLI